MSLTIVFNEAVVMNNCFFFRLDRHDYDTSLLDNNVPPRFTLPLIDQVKKVRETVELTVTGKLLVVGLSTTINIESDLK